MANFRHTFPSMNPDDIQQLSCSFKDMNFQQNLTSTMDRYGVAIVVDLCSEDELNDLEESFGKDLKNHLTNILLIDNELTENDKLILSNFISIPNASLPRSWPNSLSFGKFAYTNGLAQGEFAWKVRLLPQLKLIYQQLYSNESDLVVGEDVIFFCTKDSSPSDKNNLSAHVDQNYHNPIAGSYDVYQSALYVWPAMDSECSTTIVLPESHTNIYHKIMNDATPKSLGPYGCHYTAVSSLYDKKLKNKIEQQFIHHAKRAIIPRGGLLIWNSRTMHQGWIGGPRLAVPVCWEPKSRRSIKAKIRKARLCVEGLPTTHWASQGFQHDMTTGLKFKHPIGTIEERNILIDNMNSKINIISKSIVNDELDDFKIRIPSFDHMIKSYGLKDAIEDYSELDYLCETSELNDDENIEIGERIFEEVDS
eukprot:gene5951-8202_t